MKKRWWLNFLAGCTQYAPRDSRIGDLLSKEVADTFGVRGSATYPYTLETCTTPVADHPPVSITGPELLAWQRDWNRRMAEMVETTCGYVPAIQGWYYRPVSDAACRAIYARLEPYGA